MTRQALLVRATVIDDTVTDKLALFSEAFGGNVFVVLDGFAEADRPPVSRDGAAITLGGPFLQEIGCPHFPKVGWKCGDFALYGAACALPDVDTFWMIEPDVHFGLPVADFFKAFDNVDAQYLAYGFGRRGPGWPWHNQIAPHVPDVFGGLFPFIRIGAAAVAHLFAERRRAFRTSGIAASQEAEAWRQIPNDESFVASCLMRDGFSCAALDAFLPEAFADCFSYEAPIHISELPFFQGRIAHPVCTTKRMRAKLRNLIQKNPRRALRRMEQIAAHVGTDMLGMLSDTTIEELRLSLQGTD